MKTRKHFNPRVAGNKLLKCIIAIVIVAFALAVIGCKEDEPTPPPPQEYPIDYITYNAVQIPIYKTNGVSDAEAATAANNIKEAYYSNSMDDYYRNKFSTGVKKINILKGDSEDLYSFDKTTGVLNIGSDLTVDAYINYIKWVVNSELN